MADEARILESLKAKFDFIADKGRVARERRVWAEAPAERFREVFDFARQELGFSILCTITGLDEKEHLAIIYHLARQDGTVLGLKTSVPRAAPRIRTVSDAFPGCLGYERELVDLLGFEVEGLPPGKRYPLPDNWPAGEFPLRKDWKKVPKAGEQAKAEEKANA
jgi:Ni,Fe-hydrogenase III component G